jgi:hypothetical protein
MYNFLFYGALILENARKIRKLLGEIRDLEGEIEAIRKINIKLIHELRRN